jgi:hypothetical protein
MGWPVVTVTSGGIAVTDVSGTNSLGIPVDEATNGFGTAVTYVASGGIGVLGRAQLSAFTGAPLDFFAADATSDTIASQIMGEFGSYYNGKTYITYQGAQFDPYCIVYTHASTSWSAAYRIGVAGLTNDGHGAPAHLIDEVGRMHVFYGCHTGFPMLYKKMTNTEDPTAWTTMTPPVSNAAYPQPFQFADNSFFLTCRNGGHLNNWVYTTSSDHGTTWAAPTVFLNAGTAAWNGTDSFYVNSVKDSADTIHFTFCWKDELNTLGAGGPEYVQRYNVYYARRTSGGVWQNINGTTLATFPITLTSANAECRVYDSQTSGNFVNLATIQVNGSNAPYFCFTKGNSTSIATLFGKWNGSSLTVSTITTTDHTFDDYPIRFVSGTTWKAYLTSGGSTGLGGVLDATSADRGGSVNEWTSTDDGVTWALTSNVITAESTSSLYDNQRPVKNAQSDLVLIQPHLTTDLSDSTQKLRAWGSGGYVKRAFETETVSLFNRFSVTPSVRHQVVFNNFMRLLKDAGIFAACDGLWVLGAHDAQAGLQNWVGSSGSLTNNGMTFTANKSYKGNGTSAYLDSGLILNALTNFKQNTGHLSTFIVGSDISNNANDMGSFTGTSDLYLGVKSGTNTLAGRINNGTSLVCSTSPTSSLGHTGINRTSSTAVQFWKAGAAFGNAISAASAAVNSCLRDNASVRMWRQPESALGSQPVRISSPQLGIAGSKAVRVDLGSWGWFQGL